MAIVKPSKLPVWDINGTNIVEPQATNQSDGWQVDANGIPQKPPFQYHNYMWHTQYKWFEYLDAEKALLGGLATQTFKVANATLTDEAITLYQLISYNGNLNIQRSGFGIAHKLVQADGGSLLILDAGSTITLPDINTIRSGTLFYLKNGGVAPISIVLNGNGIESPSSSITGGETLIVQSDGGLNYRVISRTSKTPDYDNVNQLLSYNTVYQADVDLTLIVNLAGAFVNGAEIVVGNTNTPTRVVSKSGDDVNVNTKIATLSCVVPGGMYFKVQPSNGFASFETIEITVYKHK